MSEDPRVKSIRDLVDRIARVIGGVDVEWEDEADLERLRNRAREVLLEIGQTHRLLPLSLFTPEPDQSNRRVA